MNGTPENMIANIGSYQWDGPDGAALRAALDKSAATGKGILFAGCPGSGKTTAAFLLAATGYVIACNDPEKVAALRAWRSWAFPDKPIILDELGRDTVRNEYGNREDIVANFIRNAYASWKKAEWRGKLYVTTNSTGKELIALYDASIVDRLLEMCAVCKLVTDRRKGARSAPAPYVEAERLEAEAEESASAAAASVAEDGPWAGIDLGGPAFGAACAAARSGDWRIPVRILKVNMGVFGPEDCVKFMGVWFGKRTETLRKMVADFLVYAFAGHDRRIQLAERIKAYVGRVFEAEPSAHRFATKENLDGFRGWVKPYDIEAAIRDEQERMRLFPPDGFMRRYLDATKRVPDDDREAEVCHA